MLWLIHGYAMTDVVAAKPGRSLWVDAWARLRANRAAVCSAVYLVLMTLVCLVGPSMTGHQFTTIYPDYVRTPPSLDTYPKAEDIEKSLRDAMKRARLEVSDWKLEGDRVFVTLVSAKEIDERVIRYLDRSDTFEDAKVEEKSADGLKLTLSSRVELNKFYFGTDNNGRDLLTRTLIAGRVSLAIGLLAGLVAVVIGVLYGASSGFIGGKTDEVMMRIVDVLYSLPFIFFVIMLVVFFGRNFVLMFLAVGAVLWLDMARIVRGQALAIRRMEYVQAAEALGVGKWGYPHPPRHSEFAGTSCDLHDTAGTSGHHSRKFFVIPGSWCAGTHGELGGPDFNGCQKHWYRQLAVDLPFHLPHHNSFRTQFHR
jgi:oligopeptide transport system permease protein